MKKPIIYLGLIIAFIVLLFINCLPTSCFSLIPPGSEGEGEPINEAPVLSYIGDKVVNEGDLLSFVVSATDADNDPLVYSASNLPEGAVFSSGSQTFSWTPAFNQTGNYTNVHFAVTDGELLDTEEITISVLNFTLEIALVDVDPDVIQLDGHYQWLTVYIELPTDYDPEQIDLYTIMLQGEVGAVTDPKYDFVTNSTEYLTDVDENGILERMVKFDFDEVQPILVVGNYTLLITGRLLDWPLEPDFSGSDTVLVCS